MQALDTSDYMGSRTREAWEMMMATPAVAGEAADEEYPFPLVLKKKRSGSSTGVASGASTPGVNASRARREALSERDLRDANEALVQRPSVS